MPVAGSYPLSAELQAKLSQPLQIGNLQLKSRVFQAPLSGVTDKVFRRLVRRFAPESMLYTEMASAREVGQLKALPQVMELDPDEHPVGIQLFDCRPDFMGEAARRAVAEGARAIDINMGCPVNKITRKGGGSSLLRQPEVAVEIVRAVVAAVEVPVTVKTRIGWDDREITIVDFARRLEEAGACMLTVHARTRSQGYNGPAQWHWIGKVKQALSIPVIANGDIFSAEAAISCLELTGADGVMCSRGTLGYPYLVGEIDCFLRTGRALERPSPVERLLCAREHLQGLWDYKGERGIYQSRKHLAWYAKDFPGAAELRDSLSRITDLAEGTARLDGAIARLQASPI